MKAVRRFLLPAMESAMAELERRGLRWEVFARAGEIWSVRWRPGEGWERRIGHEAGVACRVAGEGETGFAAAAGSAATAGRVIHICKVNHDGLKFGSLYTVHH